MKKLWQYEDGRIVEVLTLRGQDGSYRVFHPVTRVEWTEHSAEKAEDRAFWVASL